MEIIWLLCDPVVFLGVCVPNVYNYMYSFLIEMALQTCKTKYSIRQETPADSNIDTS